MTVNYIACRCW